MAAHAQIIQYDNVPEDGVLDQRSSLPVDGQILRGTAGDGCGAPGCQCTAQDNFFQRLLPRDDAGVVFGYILTFDTPEEMESLTEDDFARLAQRAMH
ncbi:hypothetical protein [Burkholderia sp. Ac-20365]|uniref:hypothetical protein n=1 Tax=Burkholderia sp. Ac-20365 TaxID=2703897 RepID=UPI00197B2B23|nr:hypothetical protein [Burkholderia sp. Ac-20365]MBN3760907.1 hypothetical protein [Burkholderia sp. Ac-20365]